MTWVSATVQGEDQHRPVAVSAVPLLQCESRLAGARRRVRRGEPRGLLELHGVAIVSSFRELHSVFRRGQHLSRERLVYAGNPTHRWWSRRAAAAVHPLAGATGSEN